MAQRILSIVLFVSLMMAGTATSDAWQLSAVGDAPEYRQLVKSLFGPIADQLNLTPQQLVLIEQIAGAEYVRGETLMQRFNEVTAALDEEQLKEDFDEDRVRALAAQGGQAMTEMAVIKLRVKARVMALLTPAQKALVEQQLRLNRERGAAVTPY